MTHPDVLAAEAGAHRRKLLAEAADARCAHATGRTLRARTGKALVRLGRRLAD